MAYLVRIMLSVKKYWCICNVVACFLFVSQGELLAKIDKNKCFEKNFNEFAKHFFTDREMLITGVRFPIQYQYVDDNFTDKRVFSGNFDDLSNILHLQSRVIPIMERGAERNKKIFLVVNKVAKTINIRALDSDSVDITYFFYQIVYGRCIKL